MVALYLTICLFSVFSGKHYVDTWSERARVLWWEFTVCMKVTHFIYMENSHDDKETKVSGMKI